MSAHTHIDIIIVGAGISGIGAGYYLQNECPDRDYLILEGRSALGGTWDIFRYPGVRSDSDMYTLGYSFRPWTEAQSIADGPAILSYVKDTAAEFGIDRHIQFDTKVTTAEWSSDDGRWTLTTTRSDTVEKVVYTCNFLLMCAGYYSYKGGFQPDFPGEERFAGPIVHPQQWPEDLDYNNKQVVVIGSGATAVTLVPAMADEVNHITMLQRSPSYVVARPRRDAVAEGLRRLLPDKLAYSITRRKNAFLSEFFYKQTRTKPQKIKKMLLDGVQDALGPDYDVEKHFTPTYNPWDQRLCLIPDGDLFEAIKSGQASVVTDTIKTFTESGIELDSGQHLDADIIVSATGLQLVTLGEMDFFVDGQQVNFADTYTYKGMAFSDVPNLVATFGYINASWTLRVDLINEWLCRLLNHMTDTSSDQATPRLRASDHDMPSRPWIDDFSSGYMQRMMHQHPKQGDREPWLNPQRISADRKMISKAPVDDGVMQFTKAKTKLASTADS